jgi:hypothetical protein
LIDPGLGGTVIGHVVAWDSLTHSSDGDGLGIVARTTRNSINSMEIGVNVIKDDSQWYVDVDGLNDGGWVAVWQSRNQDGSGYGIFGRKFDALDVGGVEFEGNSATANDQIFPSVASLANGGFVVGYQSFLQDGDSYGVFVRRFDANAINFGSEVPVGTATAGSQEQIALSTVDDVGGTPGYTAVWAGPDTDGNGVFTVGQACNDITPASPSATVSPTPSISATTSPSSSISTSASISLSATRSPTPSVTRTPTGSISLSPSTSLSPVPSSIPPSIIPSRSAIIFPSSTPTASKAKAQFTRTRISSAARVSFFSKASNSPRPDLDPTPWGDEESNARPLYSFPEVPDIASSLMLAVVLGRIFDNTVQATKSIVGTFFNRFFSSDQDNNSKKLIHNDASSSCTTASPNCSVTSPRPAEQRHRLSQLIATCKTLQETIPKDTIDPWFFYGLEDLIEDMELLLDSKEPFVLAELLEFETRLQVLQEDFDLIPTSQVVAVVPKIPSYQSSWKNSTCAIPNLLSHHQKQQLHSLSNHQQEITYRPPVPAKLNVH